ncbi:MAG TPA: hypothetical protein VFR02_10590, partial [bacterium]|nr:hypothetical protein [bacterium]
MKAPRGKILMACCNHWTSPFQVGSHQLAREFVRLGYEVAFVSDPVSPFHLAAFGDLTRERFRIHRSGGMRDLGGGLWAYVPLTLVPPQRGPLLGSDWAYHSWYRFTLPSVVEKARRAGFGK